MPIILVHLGFCTYFYVIIGSSGFGSIMLDSYSFE
jgi:hypothetical protein